MSSASAIADPNSSRVQLRLAVLAQWVRAGLALAAGGRGLVGGAVTLWRVFQAVRLATLLARRLSELRGFPAPVRPAAPQKPSGETAAALRGALIGMAGLIDAALGRVPDRRRGSGSAAAGVPAAPGVPRAWPRRSGRRTPPGGRRPARPPGPEPWRTRPRRSRAPGAFDAAPTPIAALATGRFPLAPG